MKPLAQNHPDHLVLAPIADTLLDQVHGWDSFALKVPKLIRRSIDELIDAQHKNRFTLSEVGKTEKTHLGTIIEMGLQALLRLPRGNQKLDLSVNGVDVDIKHTIHQTWEIPPEAIGHPCVVIKEDETTARCSVGLIVAHASYLNGASGGGNRDKKRKVSAAACRSHIWWILADHPYPPNIWETMPVAQRTSIMNAGTAKHRLAALFEVVQETPVPRAVVFAVGQQPDSMKRLRRNGGARDLLAPKGIALLWGGGQHRALIAQLGLPLVDRDEHVSYKPTKKNHLAILRAAGEIV